MSKRKRDDDLEGSDIEDNHLRLKVSRLKAKTGQGVKVLHDALKLARGFERQKLGRRQKNASNEPHTLLRLREEVIVLKQLQLGKTARSRLLKILAKTKRIKEHPAFIRLYGSDPELGHVKPGAEANVVGRLFNSNPVKQALPEIVKSIQGVLGIPPTIPTKSERTKNPTDEKSKKGQTARLDDALDGTSDHDSADDADGRREDLSVSELDEDEMLQYARDRLASSDEETDHGGVDISSIPRRRECSQGTGGGSLKSREDFSISPSSSDVSGFDDERQPAAPQSHQNARQTAFLPSLSMGGYYSGSDSEDDTEQYHGPALPKQRKNRRGQRARQQIAELKYGKGAKHVGKKPTQDERSSGWDAKRGAVGRDGHSQDAFRKRKIDQKPAGDHSAARTNRTSKTAQSKSADDQRPLHPSWEAAKKRKMQDQTQASFQGKKITFD